MDFKIFPILVDCKQLWKNNITLSHLSLNNFFGVFIHVEKMPFRSLEESNIILSILKVNVKIQGNSLPLIEVKAYAKITIQDSLFYLKSEHKYALFYSRISFLFKKIGDHGILIENCQFLKLNTKIANNLPTQPVNAYGMIHSENSLSEIFLKNTIIHLGSICLSNIIHFQGNGSLSLTNSSIINNLLNSLSSSLIFIKFFRPPKIVILNSVISHNWVMMGGLLSFEGKFADQEKSPSFFILISNNTINYNWAVSKGGLVYVNVSWENEKNLSFFLRTLSGKSHFKINNFHKNKASTGSSIFWEGNYVPHEHDLANLENSFHPSPTHSFGSSVNYLLVTEYNDSDLDLGLSSPNRKNFEFKIKQKIVKNRVLLDEFYFCISLYDKFRKFIYSRSKNYLNTTFDAETMLRNLFFDQAKTNISLLFTKGMFCANKFSFLDKYSDITGKTLKVKFIPSKFLNIFSFMNQSYFQNITISFEIDVCKIGEFFDGEFCTPCEMNKFSLEPNLLSLTKCRVCTDFDNFFCYGGSFRSPKFNFWRLSSGSSVFLRCPGTACLGDEDFPKNISQRECLSCYLPGSKKNELFYSFSEYSAMGKCKTPYTGYLCSQCQEGFGSTEVYRCGDCSSAWVYMKQFLILLIKLLLFFFSNWKALKTKLNQHERNSQEFIENMKSAFLLKILFKHFTILSVLKTLPFNLSDALNDSFAALINVSPSESFEIFSFECFLKKIGIFLPPIYSRIIFNAIFYFFSLIVFIIALATFQNRENKKGLKFFLKENAQGIFNIFVLDNIVSFIDPYLRILFYKNIGDEKVKEMRLLNDFSLYAWDHLHKLFVLLFSFPIILIFALCLPIYLLLKILMVTRAGRLDEPAFQKNFGYFIFPYSLSAPYFELLIIFNKLILIIFKYVLRHSVLTNGQIGYLLLFFVYLILFYTFQSFKSPYKKEHFLALQKIELFSLALSISNTLCAIIWTLLLNDDQLLASWVIVLYFVFTNFSFILAWFQNYFGILKAKFRFYFQTLHLAYNRIFKKTLKNTKSKPQTFKNTDFKDLYEKALDKISKLEKEIKSRNRLNRILLKNIQFSDEEENCINQEAAPVKNIIIDEAVTTNKRTEFKVNRKNISDIEADGAYTLPKNKTRIKCTKPSLVSKILKGDNFGNHKCEFTLPMKENSFTTKIESVECFQQNWSSPSIVSLENQKIKFHISRKTPWIYSPFEEDLIIEIKYVQSDGTAKLENYEIAVKLSELVQIDVSDWSMKNDIDIKNKLFEVEVTKNFPIQNHVSSELEFSVSCK